MQWTQSNGNDANEMSARKGLLVQVVAEGDHLYVACVREPVPQLETPVLPRCKPTNPQSQQTRERGFSETTAPRSERSHLLGRGWRVQSYCCAIAVVKGIQRIASS
jgi:hypothetical protein